MKCAKKLPGVGKYELNNKDKVKGTYTFKEPITGVMAEAQYKGLSSPSHYNSVDIHVIKQKNRTARIYKPTTEKDDGKLKKDNSLSPCSYSIDKAVDLVGKKSIKCYINKEAKTSFLDRRIKVGKNIPGVGRYNVEEAMKRVTLGARRGYR